MIKDSAHRHGYTDSDIQHAVDHAIRVWPMDGYDMIVGPTFAGHLIEVGVNRDGDIFHAMKARRKFL